MSRQAVIPASYNMQELCFQFLAQKIPERKASGPSASLYADSSAGFLAERCRELHYRTKMYYSPCAAICC
jgi:hypothetical protein